jgi:Leucine-rich repeat (LRR) protein
LNLTKNFISKVAELAFNGLPNLETLDLSFNQLQKSEDIGNLRELPKLFTLKLNDNRLGPNFYFACIASNTKLENMFLQNNAIETIYAPSKSVGIQNLYLHHNKITNIHAFEKNFGQLITLTLSDNRNLSIHDSSFQNMKQLTYLYLDKVDLILNKNNDEPFSQLKKLELLSIRRNFLYTIDWQNFKGLSNLKEIRLSQNQLTNLSQHTELRTILPKLEQIELFENNFTSTYLENLKKHFQKNNISIKIISEKPKESEENSTDDNAPKTYEFLQNIKYAIVFSILIAVPVTDLVSTILIHRKQKAIEENEVI